MDNKETKKVKEGKSITKKNSAKRSLSTTFFVNKGWGPALYGDYVDGFLIPEIDKLVNGDPDQLELDAIAKHISGGASVDLISVGSYTDRDNYQLIDEEMTELHAILVDYAHKRAYLTKDHYIKWMYFIREIDRVDYMIGRRNKMTPVSHRGNHE